MHARRSKKSSTNRTVMLSLTQLSQEPEALIAFLSLFGPPMRVKFIDLLEKRKKNFFTIRDKKCIANCYNGMLEEIHINHITLNCTLANLFARFLNISLSTLHDIHFGILQNDVSSHTATNPSPRKNEIDDSNQESRSKIDLAKQPTGEEIIIAQFESLPPTQSSLDLLNTAIHYYLGLINSCQDNLTPSPTTSSSCCSSVHPEAIATNVNQPLENFSSETIEKTITERISTQTTLLTETTQALTTQPTTFATQNSDVPRNSSIANYHHDIANTVISDQNETMLASPKIGFFSSQLNRQQSTLNADVDTPLPNHGKSFV